VHNGDNTPGGFIDDWTAAISVIGKCVKLDDLTVESDGADNAAVNCRPEIIARNSFKL
jgi:hypothetical protein